MSSKSQGRLIVISGPSCVGKTPLLRALARFAPESAARLKPLVLFNSRAPRPGEADGVDYHFRPRETIEALRAKDRYAVIEARADLQAVDLEALHRDLVEGDVYFEGNPMVGTHLLESPALADLPRLSIFISPLAKSEIEALQHDAARIHLPDFVASVMRRKLLRRAEALYGVLGLPHLEDIETRALNAYRELAMARAFDYVLPNHDGEDSDHWDAFDQPLGDARRTLDGLVALFAGEVPPWAEQWDRDLLPT